MLPWGENTTLSEELTRESAHGGVPRVLLAVQVVIVVMMSMMISPSQKAVNRGPVCLSEESGKLWPTFSRGPICHKLGSGQPGP